MKLITDNRRAYHDYFIEDKYEAGIELFGWEVKSARAGEVNLNDSFVYFEKIKGTDRVQCVLKNSHFAQFDKGDVKTQVPRRDRRLLLARAQIGKLYQAVKTKGYTITPTKIYLNARGLVKIEIALAKGKHSYDKKQSLKEKDLAREAERAVFSRTND